jgi:hypothetical protein
MRVNVSSRRFTEVTLRLPTERFHRAGDIEDRDGLLFRITGIRVDLCDEATYGIGWRYREEADFEPLADRTADQIEPSRTPGA